MLRLRPGRMQVERNACTCIARSVPRFTLGHPQLCVLTAKEDRCQPMVQGHVDVAVIALDPHQKERLAGRASTGVLFPDDHLAQAAQAGISLRILMVEPPLPVPQRRFRASQVVRPSRFAVRLDHHLGTVRPEATRNRALIRCRDDRVITAVSVLLSSQPQQGE